MAFRGILLNKHSCVVILKSGWKISAYRIHSLTHAFLTRQAPSHEWQTAQQLAAIAYWQELASGSADATFLPANQPSLAKLVTIALTNPACWQAVERGIVDYHHDHGRLQSRDQLQFANPYRKAPIPHNRNGRLRA
jgi:hypothetical protein